MFDLGAPVQFVKGVGPQRAAALVKAGIRTVEDLLFHLPMRYEDRRAFAKIAELRPGMTACVSGTIAVAGLRRARRITLYEARLEDATGRIKALWFNQPFLSDVLPRGSKVVLYGTVERDAYGGGLVLNSPQYEVVEDDDAPGVHTGRIVPVYEKLGPLSGKALRRTLAQLADSVPADLPDPLTEEVRESLGVIGRGRALREIHRPPPEADLARLEAARSPAHVRLILEEMFLFQLGLALRRQGRRTRRGIAFEVTDRTREAVKRILPFHLTGAQKRVLREIADDMKAPHPMNRLLQGDVGSGKTVVALLAMVIAIENGYQAAFMAPTEILAEQHFFTLRRLVARCPYKVELVTASAFARAKDRAAALARLQGGEAQIAVGTHALIQEGVSFHRLGLVVVDEQHRFGVLQREDLRKKGYDADVLVMTATPIPRTLALTAYGDLDTSVLDQRPPGRTPIVTTRRPAADRRTIVEAVRRQTEAGRQAFVVYPLIAESEKLEDVKAATQMAEEWTKALPGARVGLLHGRLKSAEKDAVMSAFAAGALDVLVATTVIEVGVDVPNASLMVIEHAERFGLAQLHQLRGRVGRGAAASSCILVSHGRLSDEAKARLDVMVRSDDGFLIAEKDLEIRGPGDFFGTRQWGLPTFRVSRLIRDQPLLERARQEAFRHAEAMGARPAGDPLRAFLEDGGWERRFGLARVG
ncbi:MAG TPA: ATP-dependent DNA helicase RecG [Vicinamibacteria bacterium]